MVAISDMRWPQPRSPDELRAFYSIALHSDDNDTRASTDFNESRSVASGTWSSTDSGRACASRSTSIFSGQARTGSSATSVSDSRTVVALAPKTRHEDAISLLTLHEWQCPDGLQLEYHSETSEFVAEGFKVGVSHHSETHDEGPIRQKWRGGGILPRLNHRQGRDDNKQEVDSGPVKTGLVELELEEKFWLDTLQEHPYCNLESKRKLGRVGMWGVKIRRRDLKSSHSKKKEKPDTDSDTDPPDNDLLEHSVSTLDSDDETVHIIDDDVVDEAVSLMGSSKSRLRRSPSDNSRLGSAERTFLLDLSKEISLRSSLDCGDPDNLSLASVASLATTGTLELSFCGDLDDTGEEPHAAIRRMIGKHSCEAAVLYCCLFCFQNFDTRVEWEDHEQSQHFDLQRDWICMPWGATERQADGHEVCVFCGVVDPSPIHCSEHNNEACYDTSVTHRTYRQKADFEDHLREVHHQQTITKLMENWTFPVEYEDWYWQCGFCERSLVGWEDRSRHIGRHFREGLSMAAWDPTVPASPIDRCTGIAVNWSPPVEMNREKMLAAQAHLDERCARHYHRGPSYPDRHTSAYDELRGPLSCKYCNAKFVDEVNVRRHEKLWHLPRDVWRCPTKNDIRTATHLQDGPLAAFLFPSSTNSAVSRADVCPYCFEYAEDIFYDLNENIDECDADWEVRIEHLELEHGFNKCAKDLVFFRPDQFLLHLVGCHNMKLSRWTKEIMASCKRGSSVPVTWNASTCLNSVASGGCK